MEIEFNKADEWSDRKWEFHTAYKFMNDDKYCS